MSLVFRPDLQGTFRIQRCERTVEDFQEIHIADLVKYGGLKSDVFVPARAVMLKC